MRMLRFSLSKARLEKIRNETIRGTIVIGEHGRKLRKINSSRWMGQVMRGVKEYVRKRVRRMLVGQSEM